MLDCRCGLFSPIALIVSTASVPSMEAPLDSVRCGSQRRSSQAEASRRKLGQTALGAANTCGQSLDRSRMQTDKGDDPSANSNRKAAATRKSGLP
jgi:hypothetical protein